ncbi:DEAD/DEAH box helicase [Massilia sp. CFBP 13647]|nr:DEAD/DEAH box helicase [Massilia sp. CFBP 13647]MBD8673316.1 DEAD/DEAH box helicase [Massilia sp. CFBP 13721]
MVLGVRREGDRIDGRVAGSGHSVYQQRVHLVAGARGVRFDGDCSCPMDHNCKHVVAVLLHSLEQSALAASTLPAQAERWLERVAQVNALAPGSAVRVADAGVAVRYALVPDTRDGLLRLLVCKARLRKDGSIGGLATVDNIASLLVVPLAYVGPDEEELLRMAVGLGTGTYINEVKPAGRLGARLLEALCASERLLWSPAAPDLHRGRFIELRPGASRSARLDWHAREDAGASVALGWCFDEGDPVDYVLPTEPVLYVAENMLGELTLPAQLAALPPAALLGLVAQAPHLRAEQRGEIARRMVEAGMDRLLPPPQALPTQHRTGIAPTPCLLLDSYPARLRHGGRHWHDHVVLSFDYDGMETGDSDEAVLRRMVGDTVELVERDMHAEAAAMAMLAGLGFTTPAPGSALDEWEDTLVLPDEAAWLAFARHELPRLEAAGWRIEKDGNYRYDVAEAEDWYAELNEEGEGKGEGEGAWFALELGILVDGRRHALLPLLVEMIRNAPRDFSPATLAARADDSEVIVDLTAMTRVALPWQRIKPILATLGELYFSEHCGNALRLPVTDAARLAELEQAAQLRWLGGERLRELGRKLDGFAGITPVAAPAGLQATLRAYQQDGLAWMQFLREYGFAGILADDMGLGKTVQTLAHILVEKEAGRLDAPALVVAPTSLMGNWQAEAARFAPGLRVLLLHGKERAALFDQVAGADLVLTSYALLCRDEEALRKQRFHLLILDEAQYIKNSRARAAQVACLLSARHRLCLTGTPVQNHLGELWSQFHFLMPGLLGDEKAFNTQFRKPIEKHGDSARANLLTRRLKPFMLRRTKDKVATELPPKTEIVLPIDLGGTQRDFYETVRVAMDRKVRDEIGRKGLAASQIVILSALLKLRQVCCDPRLLRPSSEAGSAKLDTLMDLLDTLLSEGRKVLVFSQFTSMLALVEDELRKRGVEYALLTGSTVDRAAPVAAFQGGQVAVFLISLKAGGVGLNLTAADTVIHYDPWWNPASENQATDRAWRIGQAQPVFVYKLIARGTLEEKIQELQRRKGALADALLAPEGGLASTLDADDLQAILSLSLS